MHEKPCRCGANRKRFKYDLGEFYIDECCEKAGFDHLGNRSHDEIETHAVVGKTEVIEVKRSDALSMIQDSAAKKPGRGKLRDMTKATLLAMAYDKGHTDVNPEGYTKDELIGLILG